MAASDPTEIPDGVPEERVDTLYALALDEFTQARDALASELRKAGRREEATWVKGLRKPSAAAWLVNQLARTQTKERKRLLETAGRLREAHERLLGGKAKPAALRDAADRERKAVATLLERGPGLLDRQGHGPSGPTLEKAEQTLHAVALDDSARAEFAIGRLTRERRATSLGILGEGAGTAAPPKGGEAARGRDERRAQKELAAAKGEHRTRKRALESAERELKKARGEAERAQRRLEEATTALERARKDHAGAEARLEEAEAAVERAT